jgi:hypothetical protein
MSMLRLINTLLCFCFDFLTGTLQLALYSLDRIDMKQPRKRNGPRSCPPRPFPLELTLLPIMNMLNMVSKTGIEAKATIPSTRA